MSIVLLAALNIGCASLRVDNTALASGWDAVRALPPATSVRLVLTKWRPRLGEIIEVDAQQIRLRVKSSERRVERTDIREVRRLGARQTARQAKIGSLVGLAAGIYLIASGQPVNAFAIFLTGEWIGLGALLGAAQGHAMFDEILVYSTDVP